MHPVHIFDRLRYNIEGSVDYWSGEPIPLYVLTESVKEDLSDVYTESPFEDMSLLSHIINLLFIAFISFITRKATGAIYLKEISLIPVDLFYKLDASKNTYKVGVSHQHEPDVMYVVEGRGLYSPYQGAQYRIPELILSYLRGDMGLAFDTYNPLFIDVSPAGAPLYGTYILNKNSYPVFVRYTSKHAHKPVSFNDFKSSNFKKKANTTFNCCSCQAIRINRRHENELRGYEYEGTVNYVHRYVRKHDTS